MRLNAFCRSTIFHKKTIQHNHHLHQIISNIADQPIPKSGIFKKSGMFEASRTISDNSDVHLPNKDMQNDLDWLNLNNEPKVQENVYAQQSQIPVSIAY